jgi:hypothetical protein
MSKLVLVETLSQFRHRYVVELPDDADNTWAVEDVILVPGTLEEMSQCHLGEMDISHREINKEEYLRLFDEDNDYLIDWPEEKKFQFIHKSKSLKGE